MTAKKTKYCKNCDKVLNERHKTYCNNVCQNEWQNNDKVSRWLNGWNPTNYEVPDPIRKHLFEEAKYRCTECGWNQINPKTGRSPLTIDHIDGNASNNLRENLRVLCPNCHALTPTYGGLNRGNGRKARYSPA